MWLVRPLGFRVDEKTLRRAGLDYWRHLNWEVADHWEDLLARMQPKRIWYFSRFATRAYTAVDFQPEDALVFGSETVGLPKKLVAEVPERVLRIPTTGQVRSLNLSTSVGIACYEAVRQIGLGTEMF